MQHYEEKYWISNPPLPLNHCHSKASNQYLLTNMTSLYLSACVCIHAACVCLYTHVWVCLCVSNEYQLALVTSALCSEFVNRILLITVQYKQSDKNKNVLKLRACLSLDQSPCPFFLCILSKFYSALTTVILLMCASFHHLQLDTSV